MPLILDWQDPTFLGFEITFSFNDPSTSILADYDSLGNPLLMSPNEESSAIRYLDNINEPGRAMALATFRNLLHTISSNAPWHFQSISGVDNLFKIDPAKNTRVTEEAIITIDCLEGLDMKISSMIDSYRRACWDPIGHRWMLPENMRYFKCEITIYDFREFHRTKFLETKWGKWGDPEMHNAFEDSVHDGIFGVKQEDGSKKRPSGQEVKEAAIQKGKDLIANLVNLILSDIETTPDDSWKPWIKLECDMCEWDLLNWAPPFADTLDNKGDSEMATQQLKFKVGKVREASRFSELGINYADVAMRGLYYPDTEPIVMAEAETEVKTILLNKLKKKAEGLLQMLFLGNAYHFSLMNLESTAINAARAAYRAIDSAAHGRKKIGTNAELKEPHVKKDFSSENMELQETVPHNYGGAPLDGRPNPYEAKLEGKRDRIRSNIEFYQLTPHQTTIQDDAGFESPRTPNTNLGNAGFDDWEHKPPIGDNIGYNQLETPHKNWEDWDFSGEPSKPQMDQNIGLSVNESNVQMEGVAELKEPYVSTSIANKVEFSGPPSSSM